MSTQELLARLARLNETDRAWLLGELPPALRRELAELLASDEDAPATPPAPVAAQPTGWESLDPVRTAQVLDAEPMWLVSAATRAADATWRESLLRAMSARRRHDIEHADRIGKPLGARAAQIVLDGCRERVASDAVFASGAPRTGFAALVDQMRRRLTSRTVA